MFGLTNDKVKKVKKSNNSKNYFFNRLKFNLKAIEIKNNIEKTKLSFNDKKQLNNYLFNKNTNQDYYFNNDFKKEFDKQEEELFIAINASISNLIDISDYHEFLQSFINNIAEYDDQKLFIEENVNSIDESSEDVLVVNDGINENNNLEEDIHGSESENLLKLEDSKDTEESQNNSIKIYNETDDMGVSDDVKIPIQDNDYIILNDEENINIIVDSEDKFEVEIKLNKNLINKIINDINISSLSYYLNEKNLDEEIKSNLILNLNEYTSNVMFKFKTSILNDEERYSLINKIQMNINDGKINGEIDAVVSDYIDLYKTHKNKFYSFIYLDKYILSNVFKKLINNYNFDENVTNDIINKVKNDIEINNLEYTDIKTKFEIYFRSYVNNKIYYNELQNYREDIKVYCIKYNLTAMEMNSIFDEIELKINNNNGSIDVGSVFEKKIENLVMDIKTKSLDYLNSPDMVSLIESLNLANETCEKVIMKLKYLIYNENLRINQITKEYLLKISEEIIN